MESPIKIVFKKNEVSCHEIDFDGSLNINSIWSTSQAEGYVLEIYVDKKSMRTKYTSQAFADGVVWEGYNNLKNNKARFSMRDSCPKIYKNIIDVNMQDVICIKQSFNGDEITTRDIEIFIDFTPTYIEI